ncbi:MAG TPA: SLC13 family permease [Planctomycetota bacterium]|nr:SLC13 family permease [Planctomycetota bacterium]
MATAGALILFTRDRVPLATSALAVLVSLAVAFTLFPFTTPEGRLAPHDLFAGFGHEALIAVCALMILGKGLVLTGALEPVGRTVARAWRSSPSLSLLATLCCGAALSGFVNNTPVVVLLLPILVGAAIRSQTSPSRALLPMGLATLLGGSATTIGTSTNFLVVSVSEDLGVPSFDMFDFAAPAALAAGVGLLFLWLVAPRLLPDRPAVMPDTSPRLFVGQLRMVPTSRAVGLSLAEIQKLLGEQARVVRILRGQAVSIAPLPGVRVEADDQLVLQDRPDRLREYERQLGARLYCGDSPVDAQHPLAAPDEQMAEVVVTEGSPLCGASLSEVGALSGSGIVPLALHRAGRRAAAVRPPLDRVEIDAGDVLLVQGSRERIAGLRRSGELLVLDGNADTPHGKHAGVSVAIFVAVIVVAALGILPIATGATAGVLLFLVTRCMGWRDALRALSADIVFVIAASLALGKALVETGAAQYLADAFVAASAGATAPVRLSALMLGMAVLTNIVSNNAAAVIGTPIAVSIAQRLGAPPEAFVAAVLFGANMSYATPFAYKTNLLVMNAGNYTFGDFARVGIPLGVLMWLSLSVLLPWHYGI